MDIRMQVRYYTATDSWLCFTHAVKCAMAGEKVETEVEDYSSEYYLGRTSCDVCDAEAQKKKSPAAETQTIVGCDDSEATS